MSAFLIPGRCLKVTQAKGKKGADESADVPAQSWQPESQRKQQKRVGEAPQTRVNVVVAIQEPEVPGERESKERRKKVMEDDDYDGDEEPSGHHQKALPELDHDLPNRSSPSSTSVTCPALAGDISLLFYYYYYL